MLYKSVPNADKGREGVKKSENFADVINGSSPVQIKSNVQLGGSPRHKCTHRHELSSLRQEQGHKSDPFLLAGPSIH